MRIEEHIEKILRFYEYIKQGGRLSQDFHRERRQEKGNRTETRTKGSELGSVASGDAALFS